MREVVRWSEALECKPAQGETLKENSYRIVVFSCDPIEIVVFVPVNGKWRGFQAVFPDPDRPNLDL